MLDIVINSTSSCCCTIVQVCISTCYLLSFLFTIKCIFLKSDGERFTVIFKGGKINSLVRSADFVRSFDSCMSLLAKPTTVNPGRPLVNVASTSITFAFTPSRVAQVSLFTMACFFSFCFTLFTFMGWFLGGRLPLCFSSDINVYTVPTDGIVFKGCPFRCPVFIKTSHFWEKIFQM